MKKSMTLLMILTLLVTVASYGDIYMKQKRHTDGFQMMGQTKPAEDTVDEIWITDSGLYNKNDKMTMIMLSNEKKMIMINHMDKTYTEMPMDIGEMLSKAAEGQGEGGQDLQSMMGNMMKMDVDVKTTSEKQKINNWNCKKYIVTINTFMGPITQTIWATEDIPTDKKLYQKFSMAMFSAMPGMQKSLQDIMKKMEQVKGVQVKTESTQNMMGASVTTQTELLEYKTEKAPAGLFQIPAGYTKKSMPRMGM